MEFSSRRVEEGRSGFSQVSPAVAFRRTDKAGRLKTGSQCRRNLLRRKGGRRGLDDFEERTGRRDRPKENLRPAASVLAQP